MTINALISTFVNAAKAINASNPEVVSNATIQMLDESIVPGIQAAAPLTNHIEVVSMTATSVMRVFGVTLTYSVHADADGIGEPVISMPAPLGLDN